MGMLNGTPTVPTGDDYGASLGRGMGVASTSDMSTTNGMLTAGSNEAGAASKQGKSAGDDAMMAQMMQQGMKRLEIAPDANTVPNYPQDAFMEGPMMNMDMMVDKPENYGLPAGWSENMQGMMTFVRVLAPVQYDEVMRRVLAAKGATPMDGASKPHANGAAAEGTRMPHAHHGANSPANTTNPMMKMDPGMKMDGTNMGGTVQR